MFCVYHKLCWMNSTTIYILLRVEKILIEKSHTISICCSPPPYSSSSFSMGLQITACYVHSAKIQNVHLFKLINMKYNTIFYVVGLLQILFFFFIQKRSSRASNFRFNISGWKTLSYFFSPHKVLALLIGGEKKIGSKQTLTHTHADFSSSSSS